MTEAGRIADQLRRAWEGEAWHGPSLSELLDGVTAEQARRRPIAGGHTIWELVLHIATWTDVVRRRLQGETIVELPEAKDWQPPAGPGEEDWGQAVAALREAHFALMSVVRELPDARLSEAVAGKDYDVYVMLHGLVQHDLYHGGQIGLLKKAR